MQNTLNGPDRMDIIIPLFIIGMGSLNQLAGQPRSLVYPYLITFFYYQVSVCSSLS